MNDLKLPRIDRPAYFTGERLQAADLDETFARPVALHWLHNRALHGWGVAFGLAVTGGRGAQTVAVTAGYALDAAGRDLVLPDGLTIAVPPVSTAPDGGPVPFTLTIAFTEDVDAQVETRGGVCGAEGAVRRSDAPTVRFQAPGSVREGLDLVLAQVQVRNCALTEARRLDGRRSALAAGRPYVAGGQTALGRTDWRPWPDAAKPVGVIATVTTAAAGFGDTPWYQARLDGSRLVPAASSPTGHSFVVDGLLTIDAATAHAFDAIVVLQRGVTGPSGPSVPLNPAAAYQAGFLDQIGWRVVWVGVEGGSS